LAVRFLKQFKDQAMSNLQATRRAVNNKTTFWSMISAVTLAAALVPAGAPLDGASAKTPGKTYCFNRVCHRVLTLAETRRQVGRSRSVTASFYRSCKVDRFNPCGLTSSGAVYRPNRADNAASPIYPNGTKLLVWNPRNKRAAVVRINNAGPYWGRRTLDLSRAAADRLGFRHRGIARLVVKVLHAPSKREARYRRRRVYAPVRGYIGRQASLAAALTAAGGRSVRGGSVRLAKAAKPKRKLKRVASARKTVRRSGKSNRLPAAAVVAEERSLRSTKRRSSRRRVASVAKRRGRTETVRRRKKATTKQRSRAGQDRLVRKAKTATGTRNRPVNRNKSVSRQRIVTPAPAVQKPVVIAKPKKLWRRKYFGPTGAGA